MGLDAFRAKKQRLDKSNRKKKTTKKSKEEKASIGCGSGEDVADAFGDFPSFSSVGFTQVPGFEVDNDNDSMVASMGGESKAPKHLASFCGSFINFVFAISANLAGACATVEFLNCFDHFARKDYGNDYLATHRFEIENHLQHVIYALNQPAAARSYQSVFWNISVFDQNYFESMFGDFVFPDGDRSSWESVSRLQAFFLGWFNHERERSLLTFPVVTAALVHVFNHALMKGALFMACGALVYRLGSSRFDHLYGMGKRMPWTFVAIFIAGLTGFQ